MKRIVHSIIFILLSSCVSYNETSFYYSLETYSTSNTINYSQESSKSDCFETTKVQLPAAPVSAVEHSTSADNTISILLDYIKRIKEAVKSAPVQIKDCSK